MAESTSRKDQENPAFWLATQAAKMGSSCPLRISRVGPANKRSFFGHESLLTKLVRSRWLNVDVILFCIYIDLDKIAKKNFANIQPSWPHAWSITHMSSNLNSFRDYLLTFERLCDTCSLHYFNFFFFMPFILCLILMLFMHFILHQLFTHIALCRIFSHPWWFIFLITAVTGLTQTIFYVMHSVWKLSICNLFLSKFFCIHKNVQMTPKQCKRSSGNFQKLLKMTKNSWRL